VQRKTECVIRNRLSGLYGGIAIYVLRMTPEDLSRDNCRTLSFTNQYGDTFFPIAQVIPSFTKPDLQSTFRFFRTIFSLVGIRLFGEVWQSGVWAFPNLQPERSMNI